MSNTTPAEDFAAWLKRQMQPDSPEPAEPAAAAPPGPRPDLSQGGHHEPLPPTAAETFAAVLKTI